MHHAAAHPADEQQSVLHEFMRRVTRAVGHDLRTPLGTIVNYTMLLEQEPHAGVLPVRDMTERIRCHALQVAATLQQFIEATQLAAVQSTPVRGDLVELLRRLVAGIDAVSDLHMDVFPTEAAARGIEFDPLVLGFTWRAFLQLELTVPASGIPRAAHLRVNRVGDEAVVELGLDLVPRDDEPAVDLDAFLRDGIEETPLSGRVGLRLGKELLACNGASLEVVGRLGAGAGVRLHLPQRSPARAAG